MRRMISDTLQTYLKAVKANYPDPSNIGGKVNLEVDNITAMTTAQLNDLKPGDIVLKKTGNMKHTYVVTYKEENKRICMSYFDAGYLETVSYDYVTNAWVYNSTDVVNITDDYALKSEIPAAVSGTNDGTNWTSLTVGNDTYDIPQGGGGSATLYRHHICIDAYDSSFNAACNVIVDIISTSNTAITSLNALKTILDSGTGTVPNKGVLASGAIKDGASVRNIIALRISNNVVKGLYVDSSNQYVLYTYVDIPSNAELSDTVFTL